MTYETIPPGATIGILGGGQLGRMTAIAAARLGYRCHIYCPDPHSPAFDLAGTHTCADYGDEDALIKFANSCQVVTYEFENIPSASLSVLANLALLRPGTAVLAISQNRLREKKFIRSLDIATVDFKKINNLAELRDGHIEFGDHSILKTCELGYDGKGQYLINESSDLEATWRDFDQATGILEAHVPFDKELSVIVARALDGSCAAFLPGENIHEGGILRTTTVPAAIDQHVQERAVKIAEKIALCADVVGLVAVEFFLLANHQLLVNEIAPRPHNSGHWTLDGCYTDQFEQLVRAICGLPLGATSLKAKTVMKNIIGEDLDINKIKALPDHAKLCLYGKTTTRPGRKMGHVNFLDADLK